jgi:hypothetical protein
MATKTCLTCQLLVISIPHQNTQPLFTPQLHSCKMLAQKQSIKHDNSIINKGFVKYNAGSQRALNQKYDTTNRGVMNWQR